MDWKVSLPGKRSILLNAPAHNELVIGYVSLVIQLRTFAAPSVNGNLGSECVNWL